MANCDSGKNTLDPFQIVLDAIDSKTKSLEKQAALILPSVDDFRTEGLGFPTGSISPGNVIADALADWTKEAICASETDLAPINDFIADCLNDALRGVLRFLADLLGNLELSLDLIPSLFALPEFNLMFLLQGIWNSTDSISGLIASLDLKLNCITDPSYAGQVVDINTRIDQVTTDLYLDDDGSFNQNKLMVGFDSGLQTNINAFKTRSDTLQVEIQEDVDKVISIPSTINPESRF